MFNTVYQGKSDESWNAIASPVRERAAGSPQSITSPADGVSSPATILSRVVFPQPLGPARLTNVPASALSPKSCSAASLVPSTRDLVGERNPFDPQRGDVRVDNVGGDHLAIPFGSPREEATFRATHHPERDQRDDGDERCVQEQGGCVEPRSGEEHVVRDASLRGVELADHDPVDTAPDSDSGAYEQKRDRRRSTNVRKVRKSDARCSLQTVIRLRSTTRTPWKEFSAIGKYVGFRSQLRKYGYSQYCHLFGEYAARNDLVTTLHHEPGRAMFVDWAGDTIPVVDAVNG